MNEIPDLPAYGFDPTSISGLLSLVITVLLPLIVGLLTKQSWSAGAKAVLLLMLSAAKAFVEAWLDAENTGVPFLWTAVAISVITNFIIAVVIHFGLWRPTGATDAAQRSLVKDRYDLAR
jgi:hypothetical protein